MAAPDDLTLVLDIGKTRAKLLMVAEDGGLRARHERANRSVASALGYPALDVHGIAAWIRETLAASPLAARCRRAIATTHGAALVALGDEGLAWEPLDYEFDGPDELAAEYDVRRDAFELTLAPDLPAGLNAARQLHWLQRRHPGAWARTRVLLPYAQYWAWWLCGVAASEPSSLGCHTQLWQPARERFSDFAQAEGWAARFAPVVPAWQVLGRVTPARAAQLGLPADCEVHAGVHDSNACLARHLRNRAAMTLLSSGTWTVVMAPGAPLDGLRAADDMLGNVSVLGTPTPTARFMGGREFERLLDGARPEAASLQALVRLVESDTVALPAFSEQGGPFRARHGEVRRGGQALAGPLSAQLGEAARATLAALYCAQLSATLVTRLRGASPLVVEGPLAHNPVFLGALAALLPGHECFASEDALEGTARGAWLLSRWSRRKTSPDALCRVTPCPVPGLIPYHARWLQALDS
ncbi:FGGY-family carbohydrate kinase [Caldimonas tepidiphila]|uniref:FGGY-family carbohydrate kinase n=1 Tax=Caldimonas tepidiphila TaxID=2315841 RepID=UPI000E5ADFA5|nr:hypothetical protein [Caldimonas tepidiphila]